MSASTETDSEFDNRYEAYFNRPDIDGWEIRKGFGDLAGLDLVPEPAIVAAALRACRRVNDYALTTRILEVTAFKAMHNKDIWPYMVQVSTLIGNEHTLISLINVEVGINVKGVQKM